MLKEHPKGLIVLFFSNMGERYGFYTMLSIFALYLQDHFAWSIEKAGVTYGILIAAGYISTLIGGIIADKYLGYGKTAFFGLILMIIGYSILAKPIGLNPTPVYIAIGIIALGVGLFKSNLVVITGNLYEQT